MAGYTTEVDWGQLLKDRIKKMSKDGLYDVGLHDAVMAGRAVGNQKGSKPVGIGLKIGTGVATDAKPKNVITSAAESALQNKQTASAGAAAGGASSASGGVSAAANPAGGGTGESKNTTANVTGWKWGDPLNNTPFDYTKGDFGAFGGVANAALENLASDPNAQRRLWAQHMGGDINTQNLLGNYLDPETAFLLGGGSGASVTDQLKYSDALMDHAVGAAGDGSNTFRSGDIMGKIVSSLKAQPSGAPKPGEAQALNPLGTQLGQGADAVTQVNNVLNMMDQSLQFTMSERTYAAYKALIAREGQAFNDYRMTAEGATANMSFGDWLESRLGPTAGL